MNILNSVLLIDDDAIISMYNEIIIKKLHVVDKVDKCYNGKKSIEHLAEAFQKGTENLPKVIFLDLYMPRMTGWEFLDEYQKIVGEPIEGQKIFVVSSTVCEDEINKALAHKFATGFIEKPLTPEKIKQAFSENSENKNILTTYFEKTA